MPTPRRHPKCTESANYGKGRRKAGSPLPRINPGECPAGYEHGDYYVAVGPTGIHRWKLIRNRDHQRKKSGKKTARSPTIPSLVASIRSPSLRSSLAATATPSRRSSLRSSLPVTVTPRESPRQLKTPVKSSPIIIHHPPAASTPSQRRASGRRSPRKEKIYEVVLVPLINDLTQVEGDSQGRGWKDDRFLDANETLPLELNEKLYRAIMTDRRLAETIPYRKKLQFGKRRDAQLIYATEFGSYTGVEAILLVEKDRLLDAEWFVSSPNYTTSSKARDFREAGILKLFRLSDPAKGSVKVTGSYVSRRQPREDQPDPLAGLGFLHDHRLDD